MDYRIRYCCFSDQGRVRSKNQDNFLCAGTFLPADNAGLAEPLSGEAEAARSPVFAVFDGMGGEEAGEVAAHIAAKTASEYDFSGGAESLTAFCMLANGRICEYMAQNDIRSMGTTAAMAQFAPKGVTVCNLGDSRIFRLRRGELKQLSRDHVMPAPKSRKGPLLQFLGIPEQEMRIEPHIEFHRAEAGDRYLICSDGLTDMVPQEGIASALAIPDIASAAAGLKDRALAAGGKDNVTLIALAVEAVEGAGRGESPLKRLWKSLFARN